jgi:hypothetical protein
MEKKTKNIIQNFKIESYENYCTKEQEKNKSKIKTVKKIEEENQEDSFQHNEYNDFEDYLDYEFGDEQINTENFEEIIENFDQRESMLDLLCGSQNINQIISDSIENYEEDEEELSHEKSIPENIDELDEIVKDNGIINEEIKNILLNIDIEKEIKNNDFIQNFNDYLNYYDKTDDEIFKNAEYSPNLLEKEEFDKKYLNYTVFSDKIKIKMKYFFKNNMTANQIKENIEYDQQIYEDCDFLNEFNNLSGLYEMINAVKPQKIKETPYITLQDCITIEFLNHNFCENYLLSNKEKHVINNVC